MVSDDATGFELSSFAPLKYVGSAWRARFLRAPKIALELAARPDFAPLETMASVRLGLKTGADSFFFLERLEAKKGDQGQLISRRGTVTVKGLGGWQGELASVDVQSAILNPHQLFKQDDRLFSIPDTTKHVYLYPASGKMKRGLSEYVHAGELAGIHQGELVVSNGADGVWYRQARSLVSSEWVLPYNSAYDYGAWHNPNRAILNGRFVGVEPRPGIDAELLGAVLNSTFAAVGRLIEGVATGVEGAFDVGPPAARRIMLPAISNIEDKFRAAILQTLSKIRAENVMIAAPLRDGSAPALRWELDTSLLISLGMTKGQAVALLERLYSSYGRWRGNIEDVETQMRANRRQMQATGQSRDQRPVELSGRRVWEEVEHLAPLFPRAFLPKDEVLELVNIPSNAVLPSSKPLFDEGIIRTKSKAVDLGAFERVRYVAMLRDVGLVGNVDVPTSPVKCGAIADLFEQERAKFDAVAAENAAKYVSAPDALREVVGIARNHWFAACRKNSLQKREATKKKLRMN
ncbi:hypothetical protein GJ654_13520 [Rhodoblastus acidophilus]|uniref:Uncharacterized protein n=1 Tax=Rhodoblastus acidophilus TaxID=1074 RepID=A0A6N8DQ79_RHOAC|nr:hypothetical protein [Rhodoblastus acidophilus]MCW2275437.1 hypothetical protein [Rhodoblastus acidophilus]MTV32006.1 hypothetical protein [Rhodoblastus acidophilus]